MNSRSRIVAPAVLLGALALVATSCGDDTDSPTAAELDGRSFVSTEVDGETLVDGTVVTLSFAGDRLSAVAGCNTMNGGFTIDGSSLVVEQLATTQMACDADLSRQDDWLMQLLTSSPDIAVQGDELTLDGDGVEITFSDAVESASDELDDRTWTIVSMSGPAGDMTAPEGAHITWSDGTIYVNTGCNRATGSAEVDGSVVTIGPMASTLVACEADLAAWEAELLGFLTGEVGFENTDGTVVLTSGDRQVVLQPTG